MPAYFAEARVACSLQLLGIQTRMPRVCGIGSGGVIVEVYNDVALRRCLITRRETQAMNAEVKGARLVQGFRELRLMRTGPNFSHEPSAARRKSSALMVRRCV